MIGGSPEWAIERLRDPVFASAHIRESMRRQSEVERLSAELARVSSDRDEARAECERLKKDNAMLRKENFADDFNQACDQKSKWQQEAFVARKRLARACELIEDFRGVARDVGHPLAAEACRAFLAGEVKRG